MKRHGSEHIMSDGRISGESAFVKDLVSQADEVYDRRYALKRLGYNADRIAERLGLIYNMDQRLDFSPVQAGEMRRLKIPGNYGRI